MAQGSPEKFWDFVPRFFNNQTHWNLCKRAKKEEDKFRADKIRICLKKRGERSLLDSPQLLNTKSNLAIMCFEILSRELSFKTTTKFYRFQPHLTSNNENRLNDYFLDYKAIYLQ